MEDIAVIELTKVEEIVLIAVWRLEDEAYGYRIRKHIEKYFRKEFSYGHLYSILYQLDKKDLVEKTPGESTERRHGKEKMYYHVTKSGILALKAARQLNSLVWSSLPAEAFESEE
jgi:PadR family transcriptional regulator PadR